MEQEGQIEERRAGRKRVLKYGWTKGRRKARKDVPTIISVLS